MDKLLEKVIQESIGRKIVSDEDFLTLIKENFKGKSEAKFPSNIEIRKKYRCMVNRGIIPPSPALEKILVTKKMRSLSGVAVITVLTKPWPCPGKCLYCPVQENVPKSYLASEPAVMRAILCEYDPYKQVKARLDSLALEGHPTDKIELIVIGGTFSVLPRDYQEEYIKLCLDALNGTKSKDLNKAKRANETAEHRLVGLTLETRPDYITKKEVERMRYLGTTRVELGVQSVFDEVLKFNKRGATNEDTICATQLLKDAGLKICYHMMPGLPDSDLKKDLEMFKVIFTDPRFQPDYVKIYPCMVTKGSELYEFWKSGKYRPYTDKELESLICEIKKTVPYQVRIMRLIRDIPSTDIEAGSKVTNLRQNVQKKLQSEGVRCKCIRCREAGLLKKDEKVKSKNFSFVIPSDFAERRVEGSLPENDQFLISNGQSISNDQKSRRMDSGQARMTLLRDEYEASGGKEFFLSYETGDRSVLSALLRLRLPGETYLPELKDAALIREVHTYGQQIEIGKRGDTQHKGLGKKLITKAEQLACKNGYKKAAVISGVGVRDYYRKLGYELDGEYMIKLL